MKTAFAVFFFAILYSEEPMQMATYASASFAEANGRLTELSGHQDKKTLYRGKALYMSSI